MFKYTNMYSYCYFMCIRNRVLFIMGSFNGCFAANILSFLSCVTFIPLGIHKVLFNVFTTTNRLKVNSISVLVGGVVNFVVVFLLLKYTDLRLIAVAGVSSVVSIIRNLVITIPYSAKLLQLKWYVFYRDVLQSCVLSALVFMVCFLVKRPFNLLGGFHLYVRLCVRALLAWW